MRTIAARVEISIFLMAQMSLRGSPKKDMLNYSNKSHVKQAVFNSKERNLAMKNVTVLFVIEILKWL